MKKLNKKQLRAVEDLVFDLDELSNKPRRLFSALYEFAEQFLPHTEWKDSQKYKDILADMREAEEMWYSNIRSYSILEECGRAARETRKELIKEMPDDWDDKIKLEYKYGIDKATKKMASILTQNLIEELY